MTGKHIAADTAGVIHEEDAMTDINEQNSYTPVFGATLRTVVYVLGLAASITSLGFVTFGMPEIGGFIASAAGILTGGFGVAYNPTRLAVK